MMAEPDMIGVGAVGFAAAGLTHNGHSDFCGETSAGEEAT